MGEKKKKKTNGYTQMFCIFSQLLSIETLVNF